MPCEVPIMRKDKERGRVRLELTFSPEVGAEGCAAVAARAPANGVSREQLLAGPHTRTYSGSPMGLELAQWACPLA